MYLCGVALFERDWGSFSVVCLGILQRLMIGAVPAAEECSSGAAAEESPSGGSMSARRRVCAVCVHGRAGCWAAGMHPASSMPPPYKASSAITMGGTQPGRSLA